MNELLTHVDELAEAIRAMAPEVWAIYLQQAIMEGWTNAAQTGALVFVSAALVFTVMVPMRGQPLMEDEEIPTKRGFLTIAAVIFSFVAFIVLVAFIQGGLLKILNPEYYAIQRLLS